MRCARAQTIRDEKRMLAERSFTEADQARFAAVSATAIRCTLTLSSLAGRRLGRR
jgi:hypothetical protein